MPTITAIFPTFGPPSGGNSVIITGTGFTGPTSVYFGGTATTFTLDNPTQITALAPPGSGTVQVTVVNAGGVSNGVAYTYGAPPLPTLTAIVPTSGPATGGTVVVLTGTNLTGTTAVTFGATPATSFTVNSATQITAIAPAGAGTVAVTVTTAAGTSNALGYTYIAAPTILALVPTSGPEGGGNSVTILGTGFTPASSVTFGSITVVATFISAGQITATAPPGNGTVAVTVTTLGGISGPALYTYLPVPTITTLFPTSGPEAGGTVVIITGTGFTGATAVTFGAAPAAGFTVDSDTQITATAPPGSARSGSPSRHQEEPAAQPHTPTSLSPPSPPSP
ncbi:IPT/TIG domain-containing protein [Nocardia sp. 004]|uniref:IPT/TIG domain-containing protein n=1 Tax=Nocardia sp. 004 TaxID=3385978 RepID=UPI0039A04A6F